MIAEGPFRRSFTGLENFGLDIDFLAVRINRCLKYELKNLGELACHAQCLGDILKLNCKITLIEHTNLRNIVGAARLPQDLSAFGRNFALYEEPVEAVSVNHAKVVPMSIAMHKPMASALKSNARLVDLLLVIVFFLLILNFLMTICKYGFPVITP